MDLTAMSHCIPRSTQLQEDAVSDFETLLYEEQDNVAIVTLNRPEVHNAFNEKMQAELKTVWQSLRKNGDVRAAVLTGAGEKAFCTGIDREESIGAFIDEGSSQRERSGISSPYMFNDPGENICPKQNDLWKPVVAAVNGMACGGALYMLGESDIIIAAENATFFDPHVTYGMVAGFESTHLLQKLPLGETLRVMLLGAHERMSAARAHQLGLVSEITSQADLLERAMWVARAIASAPPIVIEGTLKYIWMSNEKARAQALADASTYVLLGTQHENFVEGQAAFHGKRIEWQLR